MNGKPAEPAVREAVTQLREYLAIAIERRRRERGDDLISALVAAHDDAEALSSDELLAFVVLLLVAGNETTTNLIGNGLLALARNPVEYQRLRRDPGLIPSAGEGVLWYGTPLQMLMRLAQHDTEMGGTRLEPSALVSLTFCPASLVPA